MSTTFTTPMSNRAAQANALTLLAVKAVADGVEPEDAQSLLEMCLAQLDNA